MENIQCMHLEAFLTSGNIGIQKHRILASGIVYLQNEYLYTRNLDSPTVSVLTSLLFHQSLNTDDATVRAGWGDGDGDEDGCGPRKDTIPTSNSWGTL